MSRARFIEIVAELHALDAQLAPLLDRKAALEAERDAIWPDGHPSPANAREAAREHVREEHVRAATVPDSSMASITGIALRNSGTGYAAAEAIRRATGALRTDGPTAGHRVLAFLESCPGEWMKAKDVCAGMGLDRGHIPAVRSSLDRLAAAKSVQKNSDGEFRLAPLHRRAEKEAATP